MSECYNACLLAGTVVLVGLAIGTIIGEILSAFLISWISKRRERREIERLKTYYENAALDTPERK